MISLSVMLLHWLSHPAKASPRNPLVLGVKSPWKGEYSVFLCEILLTVLYFQSHRPCMCVISFACSLSNLHGRLSYVFMCPFYEESFYSQFYVRNIFRCSKTKNTSKPPINTTQAKLPWMENLDATKSISQRSQSPVQTTSSPTQEIAAPDGRNSRSSVLAQWVEKNKSDPLRSSLDDMLEALDMWDPGNEK